MRFRPRIKNVVLGVGLALAAGSAYAGPWGAPSQGDSGQGVDTVIGNGFNPRGLDTTTGRDPNGLGPFRAPVAHTPTGSMYDVPWQEPADANAHGSIEFGYINSLGDENAAKFNEYRDMHDGFTINNFNFSADSKDTFMHWNVFGGSVGRDDQYYGGEIGCYNCWRLRFFYNETPHVFSTSARLIWNADGTKPNAYLGLKQQLQFTGIPTNGATQNPFASQMNTALRAVTTTSPDSEISLIRKKGGLRYDMPLWNNWSFYANYTLEKREGSRQFGTSGGGFPGASTSNAAAANGQPFEILEPIDYRSHEFRTGLSYADDWQALNLSFAGSFFQDSIKRMLWENPDDSPSTGINPQTQLPNGLGTGTGGGLNRHVQHITTPPDNQAYYLNLDYSRQLPWWKGNFNASLSYGWQRQDDDLQPYTTASGYIGVVGPATLQNDLSYWNSLIGPNGIPTVTRMTADLDNKVSLINLSANFHPMDPLSLTAKYRYYNFDANNDYLACNPSLAAAFVANGAYPQASCTPGLAANNPSVNAPVYGYVYEDATALGVVGQDQAGAGAGGKVRSFDVSFKQQNWGLAGDYQLSRNWSLNASYERETVNRKEREVEQTDEDKFKFGFVGRNLFGGTLRASYEYDTKDGDPWSAYKYLESLCANFYNDVGSCITTWVTAAGGSATTERPPEGAKYDLADRDQHILVARYNYAFTNTLEGMVTARHKATMYPEQMGLDSRHDTSASFELNFQPTTTTNIYGTYTYQKVKQSQVSVSGNSAYNAVTNPLGCSQAAAFAGLCNLVLGAPYSFYNNLTGLQFFRYETADTNHVFNVGMTHMMDRVMFSADYTYTHTRTPISYDRYGYVAGVFTDPIQVAVAGLGAYPARFNFPDMQWDRHQLNLSATYAINKSLGVRVLYMLDRVDSADWHYDGVGSLGNVTGAGRYYLDDGGTYKPYTAHTIGAFLQYKM